MIRQDKSAIARNLANIYWFKFLSCAVPIWYCEITKNQMRVLTLSDNTECYHGLVGFKRSLSASKIHTSKINISFCHFWFNKEIYLDNLRLKELTIYCCSTQEGTCETLRIKERIKIDAFAFVPKYNNSALKRAIAKYGPACVTINQKPLSLKFYSWGIYDNPECGKPVQPRNSVVYLCTKSPCALEHLWSRGHSPFQRKTFKQLTFLILAVCKNYLQYFSLSLIYHLLCTCCYQPC